jgi:hypothetical protein
LAGGVTTLTVAVLLFALPPESLTLTQKLVEVLSGGEE